MTLEEQIQALMAVHNLTTLDIGVMRVGDRFVYTAGAHAIGKNGIRLCRLADHDFDTLQGAAGNAISKLVLQRHEGTLIGDFTTMAEAEGI